MPRMTFAIHNGKKWYRPRPLNATGDDSDLELTEMQTQSVSSNFADMEPVLLSEERGGLWGGSTCTNECQACFGYRTRSTPSDRHIPSVTTRPLCC